MIKYMVKWCTFASEYNMFVLFSNYITFLYSGYLDNNPSSNDIIQYVILLSVVKKLFKRIYCFLKHVHAHDITVS